jgi:hypothetical protein
VVGVGASAGGLEAFTALLKALPDNTGMAFVLVQHMDPAHESALSRILSRSTGMPVSEVINGTAVQPTGEDENTHGGGPDESLAAATVGRPMGAPAVALPEKAAGAVA